MAARPKAECFIDIWWEVSGERLFSSFLKLKYNLGREADLMLCFYWTPTPPEYYRGLKQVNLLLSHLSFSIFDGFWKLLRTVLVCFLFLTAF